MLEVLRYLIVALMWGFSRLLGGISWCAGSRKMAGAPR
jgi:hypothetical protein